MKPNLNDMFGVSSAKRGAKTVKTGLQIGFSADPWDLFATYPTDFQFLKQ